MNKKFDNFLEEITGLQAKISKMEEEIKERTLRHKKLDEEAFKAKILETKGWEHKTAEVKENLSTIKQLEEEIGKSKQLLNEIERKKEEFGRIAIKEMRPGYFEPYKKKIQEFVRKLKELRQLEEEIHQMKADSDKISRKFCPRSFFYESPESTLLPKMRPITVPQVQERRFAGVAFSNLGDDPVKLLIKDLEYWGIKVG